MQPWEQLDTATVPGSDTEISLHRRGHVFSIRVDGVELMNNWIYGVDCALADAGCAALPQRETVRVLIGGLGMGFTLARTLSQVGPGSEVVVAELVPAVVRWNQELLGELAEHPLRDERVTLVEKDVGKLLRAERGGPGFDAILLDVDNGPEGLSRQSNNTLYSPQALAAARKTLRPGGVLAVWSLSGDDSFSERLRRGGFDVQEQRVKKKGRGRQMIFVARPVKLTSPAPTPSRPGAAARGKPRRNPGADGSRRRRRPSR